MGTTWSVIYAAEGGPPESLLSGEINAELLAINEALSTYIPDSEISRLNAHPGPADQRLSTHFANVVTQALELSTITAGAYDVTVGPLIELWGFGARDFSGDVPGQAAVDAARASVGSQQLDWNPASQRLRRPPGVQIDMSSIAKGYAVDRLAAVLQQHGVSSGLVEIGGELRAIGGRPEGGVWRLAVESPEPSAGRFIEALSVSDVAVATSGDYRNFFEVDGVRYSHLVDPRTGYPVAHDLVSVTVIDETCMRADALATALIVLGLEEAMRIANQLGVAAYFVSRREERLEVHYTASFSAYLTRADAAQRD